MALSEEDRFARDYFCSCCKELGMTVEIDDMGNIYATLEGLENKPPIVVGSHLDSVKKGGRFDGVLGVVAGLEVARTLVENKITPRVPFTIVNFTNEEGARFEPSMMSSGVLSGKFDKSDHASKNRCRWNNICRCLTFDWLCRKCRISLKGSDRLFRIAY